MPKNDVVIRIGSNVNGLTDGMAKAKSSVSKFAIAASIGAIGMAGLSVAANAAVNEFKEFERTFTNVVTLLDEGSFKTKTLSAGIEDLKKGVLDLRASTGKSFDDLNSGLFDLISAGLDAENSIDALRIATDLALAGATDTSTAVDGLTSAINAYGYEAGEAQRIAEKFFTAQKFGKTTIRELSTDFGKVGASAAALGVSFDEVLSSISAVTLAGIKTNEAYTGLKAVLSNVIKPSKDAADEAARLGIEFDSVALRSKGLKGFLDSITNSAKFNGESLEKLFGSMEAVNVVMSLTGGQAEDFNRILTELNDETQRSETFQNALTAQNDTLAEKYKKLEGAADSLRVAIGERLAPAFGDFAVDAAGWLDYIRLHLDDLEDSVSGFVDGLVKAQVDLNHFLLSANGIDLGIDFTANDPSKALSDMLGGQKADPFASMVESAMKMSSGVSEQLDKINEKEEELETIRASREEARAAKEQEIANKKAEREDELHEQKLEREEERRASQIEREDEQFEEDIERLTERLQGLDEVEANFAGLTALRELDALKRKARTEAQKEKIGTATAKAAVVASNLSTQATIDNLQTVFSEETAVGKAVFLIRKAQAIANTISSTQQAMALARATVPPPGGDALAAKYAIQGAINVGVITATAIGAEKGGVVGGFGRGDKYDYKLEAREIVVPQKHRDTFDYLYKNFPTSVDDVRSGSSAEQNISLEITMDEDASRIFTLQQREDRALGVST